MASLGSIRGFSPKRKAKGDSSSPNIFLLVLNAELLAISLSIAVSVAFKAAFCSNIS